MIWFAAIPLASKPTPRPLLRSRFRYVLTYVSSANGERIRSWGKYGGCWARMRRRGGRIF